MIKKLLLICTLTGYSFGQETKVTVTARTNTYDGKYAPENCWVMWITDEAGNFFKTLNGRANKYADKLFTFINERGGLELDGFTGASEGNHGVRSGVWDLTDLNGDPAPPGRYKVNVEFTETNNQGPHIYGFIDIDHVEKTVTEVAYSNSMGQSITEFEAVYEPGALPVSLELSSTSVQLEELFTHKLTATVTLDNGVSLDLSKSTRFSSSDPYVATVDFEGTVLATSPGQALITAQYANFIKEAVVTVTPTTAVLLTFEIENPQGDEEAPDAPGIVDIDNELNLIATATYDNGKSADRSFGTKWNSSDPTLASIDNLGYVKGLEKGLVTISAEYKGMIDSFIIQVVDYTFWHSWDIQLGTGTPLATVSDGMVEANILFYESTDDGGFAQADLFSDLAPSHPETWNDLSGYWNGGSSYPYAGKNGSARNLGTPGTDDVFDLQMHPPNNGHSTVAAFVVPMDGIYSVTELGVRRIQGANQVAVNLAGDDGVIVSTVTATSTAWSIDNRSLDLGRLSAGDRVHFGVVNVDGYAFDAAEVVWSIRYLDTDTSSTSTIPASSEQLRLHYNHATSTVLFRNLDGIRSISLTDIAGRPVSPGSAFKGKVLDMSGFRKGVYFIQVLDRYGSLFAGKVIHY